MFDNPRRDLQRLQQELLAAEEPEWEEEPEEEDDDPEEAFYEMKALLTREEWEEAEREPLYRRYTEDGEVYEYEEDEEEDEDGDEDWEPAHPKKKGIGGLIVAIVLEAAAIGALALWWFVWK